MNNYELMYILSATISEADVKKEKEQITKIFGSAEEANGWGMKTFAYPIQKQKQGIYVVIKFSTSYTQIKEFFEYVKFNNNVLRYLLINLDNEKVRKIKPRNKMKKRTWGPSKPRTGTSDRPQRPMGERKYRAPGAYKKETDV